MIKNKNDSKIDSRNAPIESCEGSSVDIAELLKGILIQLYRKTDKEVFYQVLSIKLPWRN